MGKLFQSNINSFNCSIIACYFYYKFLFLTLKSPTCMIVSQYVWIDYYKPAEFILIFNTNINIIHNNFKFPVIESKISESAGPIANTVKLPGSI